METAPAAQGSSNRRRFRIVDQAFQLKYAVMVTAFGAIISLTYGSMVYLAHYEVQQEISDYCGPKAAAVMNERSSTIVRFALTATVLISLLLMVLGMVATHRIAGPIFVMNRHLGVLAQGRIPSMRPLRKSDELKGLYESLQNYVKSLQRRETEEATKLDAAIEKLSASALSPPAREAFDILQAVRAQKLVVAQSSAQGSAPKAA
jgi:signal transduction histidine kinase